VLEKAGEDQLDRSC